MTKLPSLPAGRFSYWLRGMRGALAKQSGSDVPCGACTACCTSAYFILIKPEETQTLSKIPRKFLVPAPGLPKGHVLMGHYENGHCPMLVQGKCSIYQHRPRTCRQYDCRVFAAAGIEAGGQEKAGVNQVVRRWKFTYQNKQERAQHAAVRAAAEFMQSKPDCFPGGAVPRDPSRLAILALKVFSVFFKRKPQETDEEVAKAVVKEGGK